MHEQCSCKSYSSGWQFCHVILILLFSSLFIAVILLQSVLQYTDCVLQGILIRFSNKSFTYQRSMHEQCLWTVLLIVPQEREEARREEEGRKKKLAAIFKTVNIDQLHLFFMYIKHKYIVIKKYIYIYKESFLYW